MPENSMLEAVKLPMKKMFDEMPVTRFKNNMLAINVSVVNAPTVDDLRNMIPPFILATWSENPNNDSFSSKLTVKQKDDIIREVIEGNALPTALEAVNIVFLIEGISLQEVTHILRYRNASFSADCSGDKWWSYRDALVPSSIQNSDDIFMRYKLIVNMMKQLYCDMIDSKKISIMDARSILPRCLETHYYVRMNLKDSIHFIKQRIDKQIQPETDNILAYEMYLRLLELYPMMNGMIDIHAPSMHYIKNARSGKATNLYIPDEDSDKFEWNKEDFIYQCKRDEMNGTNENAKCLFNQVLMGYESMIAYQEAKNMKALERAYE